LTPTPAIVLRDVTKDYRGLRPLRVRELVVDAGSVVALTGLDQAMAEVLTKLITGASVPDTGEVTVLGTRTTAIADGDQWLQGLDRFGLLTDRALFVEQFTVEQTLAMPYTLDFEGLSSDLRDRVRQLAEEVGLDASVLPVPVLSLPAAAQVRVRFARAIALRPSILLAEHPTASLSSVDTSAFAADFSRVATSRALTAVVCSEDQMFAKRVATRMLTLQPATGLFAASSGWRRWFS
jgi:predicted ABC-type transport system involved in lysophospholipase L1 biosynthesis ATPase subunit